MSTALTAPDRLPVTPAGLVVVADGVTFVIAVRRTDTWWYLCQRAPDGLVARWRFRRRRAAVEFRAELLRAA